MPRKNIKKQKKISDFTLDNAFNSINKNINTSDIKDGQPLEVYNPLSWERTDIVKYNLPEGDKNELLYLRYKWKRNPFPNS